jgi:hypothetical protein
MPIARYTFLPWLRRGIGNALGTPAGAGASRARLAVQLSIVSDQARNDPPPLIVQLAGPGDVAGMQARQVIRTEPRAGVSDFEPNYLAAIDFYDEDFPWRYTPVVPDPATHRLAPWLVLAVLKDDEFTRSNAPGRILSSFVLATGARRSDIFPVSGQEWAWAHVHLNAAIGGLPASPDVAALNAALTANPDVGYSRLISPRKLDPNCAYTAFLVPAFELGRKAGIGDPVSDTDDGAARSWDGATDEFPIYFEWRFRTGVGGDFETLVRELVPRVMDPRVGVRDLDVTQPGFGIDDVSNAPDGTVAMEGALLAPDTVRRGLAADSDFVPRIEPLLNAPAKARVNGDDDPLVAPPIYGCWHAAVERVDATVVPSGWVDGLNLDPRYRAAAGLGAHVIRANQERYMRVAWQQIGDVLTVNHRIRRAQLATKASAALYAKSLQPLPRERIVAIVAPVFGKVLASRTTLASKLKGSRVPRAAVSPALRKQLRPRGRLARSLFSFEARATAAGSVLRALDKGTLSTAPPASPVIGATLERVNEIMETSAGQLPAVPIGQPGWRVRNPLVDLLSAKGLAATAIASTPAQAAFVFRSADTDATLPTTTTRPPGPIVVPGDDAAAADMRAALIAFGDLLSITVPAVPEKPSLDLELVEQQALAALEPHAAFTARFAPLFDVNGVDVAMFARDSYVNAPPAGSPPSTLPEVMNYPDIKDPMYEPLDRISSDCFVPNLKLVPNNTISLLQTNQPFIEAYLAGLNHEFARELLWREYPTDQRGSCFRQFWDVSSYVDRTGRGPKELAESLKDIPPIHQWDVHSALGAHDHRDANGERTQVVLVIRGDLLKRYPNTFIYAQKAAWGTGPRANRLVLSDETGELFAISPNDPRLRFPLYKARVDPDLHFVGFDLTLDEARGDARLGETAVARAIVGDDVGWFFVLQEAIGEPRFGLDSAPPIDPSPVMWDNLSWANIDLGAGQAIDVAKAFVAPPAGGNPGGVQWGSNAADMADIFYQDPVMVAVHGRNMLKDLTP